MADEVKRKPKFKVGQVVVNENIMPRVFGVVLRNRKTGKYGVLPFYRKAEVKIYTDLENWRALPAGISGEITGGEMADEAPTPEVPKARAPVPVCPYCGKDPCLPDLIEMTSGRFLTKIACCDNPDCRKIFCVQIIGEKPKQIVGAQGHVPPFRQ
jgi:ssDNA-binding Zn-finger/Zn-ribbon topoisomerase 1